MISLREMSNDEAAFSWGIISSIEEENEEMTDTGYREILDRIKSIVLFDIPNDLTADELRLWLLGYQTAISKVENIINDMAAFSE